jgi:hypothetical protein
LFCLIGAIIGGYTIYLEYQQGATDQIKYAAIMATVILLISCGFSISRSLKHLELRVWHLRSAKIALIVGVIQAVIGVVYAFALAERVTSTGKSSPRFFVKPVMRRALHLWRAAPLTAAMPR